VLVISNEEPWSESLLRLRETQARFNISDDDIGDRLHFISGYHRPVTVAEGTYNHIARTIKIQEPDVWQELDRMISMHKFDAVVLDPLVNMVEGIEENDNVAMARVMEILRRSAEKNNIAILLVHHANKAGSGSDPDGSSRGASAIVNSLRSVVTFEQCNEKMLAGIQIPEGTEHLYVRVTGGKSNLSARRGTSYLKLVTGIVPATLDGKNVWEEVAVLEPVPDSMMEKVTFEPAQFIRDHIIALAVTGREAISKAELCSQLKGESDKFKREQSTWEHVKEAIPGTIEAPFEFNSFKIWVGKGTEREEWTRNAQGVFVQKITK